MFWPPFTWVQQDQAQKEATKLQLLGVVGGASWGKRSQFAWGKGTEQGSKWHVAQTVSSLKTGTMPYWPMSHKVLRRREVSSLGRLILEASKNWANTGLRSNMCRRGGWRYHPLHLSPTWGSQDLPTAVCIITLCKFQSTAPHSLTQNWLSEQMLMGKSCWNDESLESMLERGAGLEGK